MLIPAEFDIRQLASAVIVQAIRDYRGEDKLAALDAAVFLAGPDAPLWLEGLGLNADPVVLVTADDGSVGESRDAKTRPMKDATNIPLLFAGLSPEQAKELRARILAELETLREEIAAPRSAKRPLRQKRGSRSGRPSDTGKPT